MFDIQAVAAQYNEPASPSDKQNTTVYADACGWPLQVLRSVVPGV